MRDPDAVQCGTTACWPAATMAARVRIMGNITEYIDFVKSTCVDPSEVEGAILENFGELPSAYIPRVTGTAKEDARLGLINDFAAYTAKTPYQVMVIDTAQIWSDSSDEELHQAVRKAEIRTDTEFVKCRVFCVVFHKKHYDLGVVRCQGMVKAVFAAGAEWEAAVSLMLAFVKSKSPARGGERGELCPRWVPPVPARAPPPASHAKAKSQRGYKALPPNTNTPGRARVSEKEDTSPPLSLSSSLPSVVSVSVSSLVAGDEKYTTQSAGVPKHHSSTHPTGV